jgi:two-component system, NtrC family, response regulator AtoC
MTLSLSRSTRNLLPLDPRDPCATNPSDPERIVIVWDPERSRSAAIGRVVSGCGARPRWLESAASIQDAEASPLCSVALVALGPGPTPGSLSLEVVRALKQRGFKIICYAEGSQTWAPGVQCQALLAGGSRLLDPKKAGFPQDLRRSLAQLLKTEAHRVEEESRIRERMKTLGIMGESAVMVSVFRWILRVSPLSDLPILISGETGTGKELLARAIHQCDPKRRNGPFVAVNCGAISSGLAESEFFGHRRGAFTGARDDRKGLIRAAEGGVLLLDEIGELNDGMHAKLLRFLQENRVLGVGEDREVAVSVRIVAATNRDLHAMVEQGQFRADLFHRLNVLSIQIPPLRERPGDVEPMIRHFLQKHQHINPVAPLSVDRDFIEALRQVELPGNARHLENLVRYALANKEDDTPLSLSDLPPEIWQELSGRGQTLPTATDQGGEVQDTRRPSSEPPGLAVASSLASLVEGNGWSLSRSIQYCERVLLEAALQRARGNHSQTARLLGITPRSVYNKVRKHHLCP